MDKSWICLPRDDPNYIQGVKSFIEFAYAHGPYMGRIYCPCKKCVNCKNQNKEDVLAHLLWNGIMLSYTNWTLHGESKENPMDVDDNSANGELSADMHGMLRDAFGIPNQDDENDQGPDAFVDVGSGTIPDGYYNLLRDAEQDLYPGCKKFTKLSFLARLFQIKCLCGWSNKSFTVLLELLKEVLPEGEVLPNSYFETRKIIRELGFDYKKIHACPNDCMLYWKEDEARDTCKVCGESWWEPTSTSKDKRKGTSSKHKSKIPRKVLRYFPLKPRLQRLFMSSRTALSMRWHEEGRKKDGALRHPADSPA
ncbi:PREDICTED: uncharacterized protein LOC104589233 isoform X2 [Nelumbo nucifera]|uniref:Uncharacterized protein LOC104589233 isoform X2 n=1 Tax=Nelumbo nucifera TaxID=4432 RepID=A0A1U8PZ74_NELNU|nr:PREDICTED: uncharacterized protein LOC104589233 isoform X2 [Nelumbo nucifera]